MGADPSVSVSHLQAKEEQQKEEFSPVQVLAMNLVTVVSVTGCPYSSCCRGQ